VIDTDQREQSTMQRWRKVLFNLWMGWCSQFFCSFSHLAVNLSSLSRSDILRITHWLLPSPQIFVDSSFPWWRDG